MALTAMPKAELHWGYDLAAATLVTAVAVAVFASLPPA
jgi:hypothetical protein